MVVAYAAYQPEAVVVVVYRYQVEAGHTVHPFKAAGYHAFYIASKAVACASAGWNGREIVIAAYH